jgi:IS1 family transposase
VQNAQCSQSKVRGWSNLPTANSLTHLEESILLRKWEEGTKYVITGPRDNKWFALCRSCEEFVIRPTTDKYPVFRRVRTICRDQVTGVLKCLCFHFEGNGICCRHVLAVLRLVYRDTFQGITETSIQVFGGVDAPTMGVPNLKNTKLCLTFFFFSLETMMSAVQWSLHVSCKQFFPRQ